MPDCCMYVNQGHSAVILPFYPTCVGYRYFLFKHEVRVAREIEASMYTSDLIVFSMYTSDLNLFLMAKCTQLGGTYVLGCLGIRCFAQRSPPADHFCLDLFFMRTCASTVDGLSVKVCIASN